VALSFTGIGLVLLAAATTWWLLVPSLGLLVVGQGLATPTLSTLVAGRAQDARRGGALGFQQSAGALARIVGPAMGGILFEHVGVAAPYVVGAAMVGVALLLVTGLGTASEPGWRQRLPAGNLTPWESSR
jgi:MFS family permease